ncbi:DUF924 family protein [Pokkaliibacter sp. CJK22405]|uniref:DUF924 family protein n=1 Tax=Pokkaliibacter sp. CJK22405 TaxID=3384615 RepID=UPI0039851BC1
MTPWRPVLFCWFGSHTDPAEILSQKQSLWFNATAREDERVAEELGELHRRACLGELDGWANDPVGRLALIILLDQVSRQLYRGSASAYSQDGKALMLARDGIAQGMDQQIPPLQRLFFYLPFEHSENLSDQQQSLTLFRYLRQQGEAQYPNLAEAFEQFEQFAQQHYQDILNFGRFPYRNAALGRANSPREAEHFDTGN